MKKTSSIFITILFSFVFLLSACNGGNSTGTPSAAQQTLSAEQQVTVTPTSNPVPTTPPAGPTEQGELILDQLNEGAVSNRDGDLWTFSGTVGDQISIAVDGTNRFDTVIDLYDENGTLLLSDDDSGSGYNSLINGYILPFSGEFTVIVSGYGGARGAYSIVLTEGVAVVQSSIPVDMGSIAYGQEMEGEIEDAPGHIYTFTGAAGDIVNITLVGDQGNVDTFLELYNASGTQVASDNDSGVGSAAAIQNFSLPSSGTFTILTRFFEGGAGSYNLSLSQGYMEIPANQPGECMTNAYDMGTLEYGQQSNSFTISEEGDRYLFTGTAGDEIFINMYGLDGFDPYLELYDQACNPIASNDDSNGTLSARITMILTSSEAFTIIARSLSDETGDYLLTLSEGEETTGYQSDPNLNAYDMGTLQIGSSNSSFTISSAGDMYTFNASAGTIISVTVTNAEFTPILELHDSEGTVLISSGETGTGNYATIRRFSIPASGDYVIIIRGVDGQTGDYQISLTQP